MSEPMTSGEIEDILSSIRRLVSEDLRPAPRTGGMSLVSGSEQGAGRLLLTPALRVVDPVLAPDPEPDMGETDTGIDPWEVPCDAGDEVFQPDDPQPGVPRQADAPIPTASAAEARGVSETTLVLMPDDMAAARAEAATDAPVEDAGAVAGGQGPEDAPADALASEALAQAAGEPLAPGDREAQLGTISAAVGRSSDGWEPETGDAPVTRLSWIDVAEAAAGTSHEDAPQFVHRRDLGGMSLGGMSEETRDDGNALIGVSDDVLDEAVLREIVRAVLREELQGHLGERITRNIRKLVRAEIHRAIALRDFE